MGKNSMLNKVPEVTLIFWLIKMMSTTVGETAADFLNFNLHMGLTVTSVLTGVLLAVSLFVQMRVQRYIPVVYWLTVVFISVFGTLITDNMTDNFGVPLMVSTGIFSVVLIATFAIWHKQEKTLSILAIDTPRREAFYWLAILFTFALGTAAGDLVAEGLGLGYLVSAAVFEGLIAVVAFAHFVLKINPVLTFWVAYILTRPLGASFGDWLSQDTQSGGLGLGTTVTSIVFLAIIVGLVGYLTVQDKRKA